MNATDRQELMAVWEQVRRWPAQLQVSLARRLLDAADTAEPTFGGPTRGKPVSELIGLGAGSGNPPSDETVRQWLEEHRAEKYGS